MNFKVSIIVPCYNQGQFLNEALESVLNQNYQNWECIIVNDGSWDDTERIAKHWVDLDLRFKYLYQSNGGLSSARNFGILHAAGELILPLDADDKISIEYSSSAVKAFEKDNSLKIVYCKAERFGEESGPLLLLPFSLIDLCRVNMIFCSGFFKKEDWERVGGYDVKMIYGLEDWEFWISILKDGGGVYCLEEVGFFYRIRKNSMARFINPEERQCSEHYVTKKHLSFFLKQYDIMNMERKKIMHSLRSEKFLVNLLTKKIWGINLFKINS